MLNSSVNIVSAAILHDRHHYSITRTQLWTPSLTPCFYYLIKDNALICIVQSLILRLSLTLSMTIRITQAHSSWLYPKVCFIVITWPPSSCLNPLVHSACSTIIFTIIHLNNKEIIAAVLTLFLCRLTTLSHQLLPSPSPLEPATSSRVPPHNSTILSINSSNAALCQSPSTIIIIHIMVLDSPSCLSLAPSRLPCLHSLLQWYRWFGVCLS
jgi:hypothetical protein